MNQTTAPFDLLLSIALDLNASLTAEDRYRRLVASIRRVLPCDAAVLMRLDGEELIPLEAHGLVPDAMGRRFRRRDHPRLDIICKELAPRLFPPDSPLPDPFDGLLESDPHALNEIHACLGCPLWAEGELIGVLSIDALEANAFDRFDPSFLAALGALAGAAMRTSNLIETLEHTAARHGLVAHDLLREAHQRRGGLLIGSSPVMTHLREEIALVARSDFTVLIAGETGVGKELVARSLHAGSTRAEEPLIYVNCAALPETVAESELFGHVRGAFTGAEGTRAGKFEVADGGTLFLDEIGELPLGLQPKLLRALQEGEIQRVGSDRSLHVDVRIVAATNRDLAVEVEAGRFRADLFHRLNVYRIEVPPLRQRREDIPALAGAFCDEDRRRLGLGPVRLEPAAVDRLTSLGWPGNVRELQNSITRAVLHASAHIPRGDSVIIQAGNIEPGALLAPGFQETGASERSAGSSAPPERPFEFSQLGERSLRKAVEDFQREVIRSAVEHCEGNWAAAARTLGMQRSNLHQLAKRLGLHRETGTGSSSKPT
ncbi:MAG: nitric oxide reductase transcriptional regulator NorR [bacterium]|nr:nitric oxide reductase transcriptional regulator NorR [bacterium]